MTKQTCRYHTSLKKISKPEKLRLHCCGTNKIKLLKCLLFSISTYPFGFLCPGSLTLEGYLKDTHILSICLLYRPRKGPNPKKQLSIYSLKFVVDRQTNNFHLKIKLEICQDRDFLRPIICKLSRLRFFETRKFGVVETETDRD